ncbi:hypothetical protein AM499_06665 [Bacillus sp. FJAT-22090]|uniref:hypothetical protein n=1 Tax=Bacillus sp. FJAT-22090 TaxID=1581038 RepID=UPI0006AF17F1|nr:hypothetical protein [Bacillus sp. FJAT-22090]ALC85534.1 hypothetical protein AM499_06665 [Bacillus sp. FJAT-22090]
MIIEVSLGPDSQYVRCLTKVGRNIRQLQNEFFDWLFDRKNNHKYWKYDEEAGYIVNYDAEALVYWLNHIRFKKGKKVAALIDQPNISPKKKIEF